jgi:hypothetical protein
VGSNLSDGINPNGEPRPGERVPAYPRSLLDSERSLARSGADSDNCVEVAFVDDAIAVRDSKNPSGPALIFTAAEWDAFVHGAKDGEFDL